jgi:polar amino acid transport system substrate-binding protein
MNEMARKRLRCWRKFAGGMFASFAFIATASASCTRTINIPAAAAGKAVIVHNEIVSGIYPTLLREFAEKAECPIEFIVVPQARALSMFAAGYADLLIPAFKTPTRDQIGEFVPLIRSRATLITLKSNRKPIKNMQQILKDTSLHLVVVRGFDYGANYQRLIEQLKQLGRVSFESDVVSVARILKAGHDRATIMTPTILYGAIHGEPRVEDLVDNLSFDPLEELPWGESGAYLAQLSLKRGDRDELRNILAQIAKSPAFWKAFQHYFPPKVLNASNQPLH